MEWISRKGLKRGGRALSILTGVGLSIVAWSSALPASEETASHATSTRSDMKSANTQQSIPGEAGIERKLAKILANQDTVLQNQQTLLQKLDAVMEELRIIKVRSTH